MTSDQLKCIQLRDCFYAGYSMPQYCVDAGIKNPIIVSYDPEFLWELYVQFRYDKRMFPKFCLLKGKPVVVSHGGAGTIGEYRFDVMDFSETDKYDKIILLTTIRFPQLSDEKTIYFDALLRTIRSFVYYERPIYNYINQHPHIKVLVSNANIIRDKENVSEYEKKVLSKPIHALRIELAERGDRIIKTRYDRFGYSNDEIYNILNLPNSKINPDGTTQMLDNNHPMVMIQNGKRKTAYQPDIYEHTIYFVGSCTYGGIGASYDRTIESYLQKKINENGYKYRVENYFQLYNRRYQDIFYNLNTLPVKDGDIIFVYLNEVSPKLVPFLDIGKLFEHPHKYGEVFVDQYHINESGYQIVAEKFYDFLVQNNFFKDYEYKNIPTDFPQVHNYGIVNSNKSNGGGYNLSHRSYRSLMCTRNILENSVRLLAA